MNSGTKKEVRISDLSFGSFTKYQEREEIRYIYLMANVVLPNGIYNCQSKAKLLYQLAEEKNTTGPEVEVSISCRQNVICLLMLPIFGDEALPPTPLLMIGVDPSLPGVIHLIKSVAVCAGSGASVLKNVDAGLILTG